MKFALNWYHIEIPPYESAPIEGAIREVHPYGIPPFEMRNVWTVELATIAEMVWLLENMGAGVTLTVSGFWSGDSFESPGSLMHAIALFDDPDAFSRL
jgi:hypothetical protein